MPDSVLGSSRSCGNSPVRCMLRKLRPGEDDNIPRVTESLSSSAGISIEFIWFLVPYVSFLLLPLIREVRQMFSRKLLMELRT